MATGADLVTLARQQIGDPYVFGAEGPDSFDCSGLVQWVAQRVGLSTPRTTAQMMSPGSNLVPIGRSDLREGDLIFSNWGSGRSSHVGIFTGKGTIIEAPQPGDTVKETTLGRSYWAHTDAFRRIPGVDGRPADPGAFLAGVESGLNIAGLPFPIPTSAGEALANIGQGIQNVAVGASKVGNLAGTVGKLFLPSNAIRAAAFFFGTIFILIGIMFLAWEVKE